jgi:hypothetical protein
MKLFRILTTPSCWLRNKPTNKALSRKLNRLMDENTPVKRINRYLVQLGGIALWQENYPYCCYYMYDNPCLGLPDRTTVFRLYDYIAETLINDKPFHSQ